MWNRGYIHKPTKGRRKKHLLVADQPMHGGGGGVGVNQSPQKNMYFDEKNCKIYSFGHVYVLDYSRSFDMHIKKFL